MRLLSEPHCEDPGGPHTLGQHLFWKSWSTTEESASVEMSPRSRSSQAILRSTRRMILPAERQRGCICLCKADLGLYTLFLFVDIGFVHLKPRQFSFLFFSSNFASEPRTLSTKCHHWNSLKLQYSIPLPSQHEIPFILYQALNLEPWFPHFSCRLI